MTTGLSLRAYGRHRGCSVEAVRRAIKRGRLHASLGADARGQVRIVDAALADREWAENTDLTKAPTSVKDRAGRAVSAAAAGESGATVIPVSRLNAAQTQATEERARKLKIENDLLEGRLVHVDKAAKEAFEANRIIREAMLNIPARLSGELAAETDAGKVHLKLDAAIREALTGAADSLLATANG